MILETTNPKYKTRPQVPGGRRFYIHQRPDHLEDFASEGSRNMARGKPATEQFQDRRPNEAPRREPEPRVRPSGSSLFLVDQAHDAPLWLILDRFTGVTFARVRGTLPWVVDQLKLAAHQLGGQEQDLYFKRADYADH